MREILFRGKTKEGDWIEGYYYPDFQDTSKAFILSKEDGIVYEVDPESVGQFTGLADKDGLDIFEGDFLEHDDYTDGACITFKQYVSVSQVKINNLMRGCNSLRGLSSMSIKSGEIKVIGNIHDNPELLKWEN